MRVVRLLLVLSCLMSYTTISAQTSKKAKHLPLLPATTPQGLEGGFWRTDINFDSVLHLKNVLLKQALDVTPEIFFADGTEYDLPVVHLDPAGVASVDIKATIEDSDVPQTIQPHISKYGMVGISYQWSWQAVLVSIQNTDEIVSLSAASAPLGKKSVVHHTPEAIALQVIRSSWWRPTKDSDEVITVGNTSLTTKQVQIRLSDASGNLITSKQLQLLSHQTALLRVNDFLSGSVNPGEAGDLTMLYSGAPHAIVASASIEDTTTGFSFTPHIVEKVADSEETMHTVTLHAPGLMLGRADTTMGFPPGTVFTPYAVLHNISGHAITAALSVTSDGSGGNPATRPLDTIPLASGQTARLDMTKYFNPSTPLPDGFGHLSVAFTGKYEDLLFDVGSVDQTENYVFPVVPSAEAPTTSKTFCFWALDDRTSTMISIWNFSQNKAQDATLTLYYSGGEYHIPLHLSPRKTYNLDLMELVRNRVPDANGKVLPDDVTSGSAMLVGPKGEFDKMTVVASASTYNVRNATCWPVCLNCGGLTSLYLDPDTTIVKVNGWNTATAYYTSSSGGPYSVESSGTWSTLDTSIATVNGSGTVYGGQAPGTTNLLATMSAPLGETECYFSAQTICEDQTFEGSGPVNVYSATITNADINANTFSFYLTGPSGASGPVSLTAQTSSGGISYSEKYNGGASVAPGNCPQSSPCTFPLTRPNIPSTYSSMTFYTGAMAIWSPAASGGYGLVPSNLYLFGRPWFVFGNVTDTQYNTPSEVGCSTATETTYIYSYPACTWQTAALRTQFVTQVQSNGTGNSIGNGILKYDMGQCTGNTPQGAVRGSNGNVLASVANVTGQCGTPMIAGQSVAVYPGPQDTVTPFNCGDEVILVAPSTNTNAYVKSIADRCPGCSDGHVDNYASSTACSGSGVGNVIGSPFWNVDDR